jgi:hypothetical protein
MTGCEKYGAGVPTLGGGAAHATAQVIATSAAIAAGRITIRTSAWTGSALGMCLQPCQRRVDVGQRAPIQGLEDEFAAPVDDEGGALGVGFALCAYYGAVQRSNAPVAIRYEALRYVERALKTRQRGE